MAEKVERQSERERVREEEEVVERGGSVCLQTEIQPETQTVWIYSFLTDSHSHTLNSVTPGVL